MAGITTRSPGGSMHDQRNERYHPKHSMSSLLSLSLSKNTPNVWISGEVAERRDRPVIWHIKRTAVYRCNQSTPWVISRDQENDTSKL